MFFSLIFAVGRAKFEYIGSYIYLRLIIINSKLNELSLLFIHQVHVS